MNIEIYRNPFEISIADVDCNPAEIQARILDLQDYSASKSNCKDVISTITCQDFPSIRKFFPSSNFPKLPRLTLRYF
jgi:hypothetical protein